MTTTDSAPSTPTPAHPGVASRTWRYGDRSRRYAERGDVRLAVLAVWAADVEVLQELLWESGLGSAPDPQVQLAAVAAAVDGSLRAQLGEVRSSSDARSVVLAARAALCAAFDESVHPMLEQRFMSLDHLEGLVPQTGAAVRARDARLAGRSAPDLVADLHIAAADCMVIAGALAKADLRDDALHHARLADVASFEAYLVTTALAAGDSTLTTVDLRWDLALASLESSFEPPSIESPSDLGAAVEEVRSCLVLAVGPSEEAALRSSFEPVAPGLS